MEYAAIPEEHDALRREVDRFARRSIEPCVARPGVPAAPEELAAVLARAEALGIAGSDDEPTGLGTWESLVDDGVPGASLDTLVRLAQANAATAYVVHQRALARSACRMAGLAFVTAPLAIATTGVYGLGRHPLVRWLANTELEVGDHEMLDTLYRSRAQRVASVEHGFAGVVVPEWSGISLQWVLARRECVSFAAHPNAHGLDELATGVLSLTGRHCASTLSPPESRAVFAALVGADQLASVAIAAGSVQHGLSLALDYASRRRQGGVLIQRHAAVQQLLARASSSLAVVGSLLERAACNRLDGEGFMAALVLRSRAMPALADAANAAMQVLGGMGYMRDVGAEKVVRDVNHLRALAGPMGELDLMAAEWGRIHA